MDFRTIILMSLQILHALPKKYVSSSDESIENLLYYKGCNHEPKTEEPTRAPVVKLSLTSPQPECAHPKMCCSLTCGESDCANSSPFTHGRMDPMQQNVEPIMPIQPPPRQPQPGRPQLIQKGRKKKAKQPMRIQLQPPIGSRRDFGVTKDRIKSLISKDDDIRKILKDLVRVTMQKVDLVDMINARRADMDAGQMTETLVNGGDDEEYFEEDM